MKTAHRYATPPLVTIPSKVWLFSWGGKYIRTVLLEVALKWPFLFFQLHSNLPVHECDQRATTPLHLRLLQRIKINLENSPALHPYNEPSCSTHKFLHQTTRSSGEIVNHSCICCRCCQLAASSCGKLAFGAGWIPLFKCFPALGYSEWFSPPLSISLCLLSISDKVSQH